MYRGAQWIVELSAHVRTYAAFIPSEPASNLSTVITKLRVSIGLRTALSRMNSRSSVLRAASRVTDELIVTRSMPPGLTSIAPWPAPELLWADVQDVDYERAGLPAPEARNA